MPHDRGVRGGGRLPGRLEAWRLSFYHDLSSLASCLAGPSLGKHAGFRPSGFIPSCLSAVSMDRDVRASARQEFFEGIGCHDYATNDLQQPTNVLVLRIVRGSLVERDVPVNRASLVGREFIW